MTIRNPLRSLLFFLTALLIVDNTYATDVIDARIKNTSNADWTVQISLMEGTLAAISDCQNGQDCDIPANSDKLIFYNPKGQSFLGKVIITDNGCNNDGIGKISKRYVIKSRNRDNWWDKIWYSNEPEIIDDGTTGTTVELNRPGYGSIIIRGSKWCGNL